MIDTNQAISEHATRLVRIRRLANAVEVDSEGERQSVLEQFGFDRADIYLALRKVTDHKFRPAIHNCSRCGHPRRWHTTAEAGS